MSFNVPMESEDIVWVDIWNILIDKLIKVCELRRNTIVRLGMIGIELECHSDIIVEQILNNCIESNLVLNSLYLTSIINMRIEILQYF